MNRQGIERVVQYLKEKPNCSISGLIGGAHVNAQECFALLDKYPEVFHHTSFLNGEVVPCTSGGWILIQDPTPEKLELMANG